MAEPEQSRTDQLVDSLHRSQAIIEFTPNGEILDANQNFLSAVGYTLDEIVGRHHRMFVDDRERGTAAYDAFWRSLADGKFQAGEYQRFGKGGREIWIQATYNPIFGADGTVERVVKLASDITAQRAAQREIQDRTTAAIEFEPNGTILTANELFLGTVGYALDEIRGQHHRMFMPPGDADTADYQDFWPSLARGEFKQGEFRRVDRHGQDLWLQGAYNPILDADGKVTRVVKTVANITDRVLARQEASEVGGMIAQAVNEMTSAISEIAQTTSETSSLAKQTEDNAAGASERVARLETSSDQIGKILEVIQGLAAQTNLLALNATIESARAGEVGKGFAVVANEVKMLATQTSDAANDIGNSIEAIQTEVASVVQMIGTITESATDVTAMTTTVASAVEEQSSVMASMNQSADRLLTLSGAR